MDVARRMHVHLPGRIVLKGVKGLHVTSVRRKDGGGG